LEPIRVRGSSYLSDQKKVPTSAFHFDLMHVDIMSVNTRLAHVASRPDSYAQKRPTSARDKLLFVVNWLVPGTPECNWVSYFQNKEKDNGIDLDLKKRKKKKMMKRMMTIGKKVPVVGNPPHPIKKRVTIMSVQLQQAGKSIIKQFLHAVYNVFYMLVKLIGIIGLSSFLGLSRRIGLFKKLLGQLLLS